nr:alkaline shock response membrane anchor protein AmaP [Streptomyces cyaneofuscatus]
MAVGDGSGLGRMGREVPAWWSGRAADGVLLDRDGLARVREAGWWTPAVIAGLVLVLALFLRWFAGQVSSSRPRWVGLMGAGLTLRRRAWERAMTAQAAAVDGVAHARVRVAGRPLRATVTLVVEPEARPAEVVRRVAAGAAADARRCAGVRGLPTDVRVRVANRRERRTR